MKTYVRKNIYKSSIIIIISLAIICVGASLYSKNLHVSFKEEITSSLGEITEQSIVALRKEINGEIRALQDTSILIGSQKNLDLDLILDRLHFIAKNNGYKRMGLISINGVAHTTDDLIIDLSDRQFFKEAMKGKIAISEVLNDKSDGEKINVTCVPIYTERKITGALFATRPTTAYQEIMEAKSYNEEGYSYIVKQNGDAVTESSNKTSFAHFTNIFTELRNADSKNNEATAYLEKELLNNSQGYIEFNNKIEKYMYYAPIGISDWYLLMVVPVNLLNAKMNFVMGWSYAFSGGVILVFSILAFRIFRMQSINRKKIERIAYVDELTGERTYVKYKSDVSEILTRPVVSHLAVVSLDIDKFRYINDIFGYQEGNIVIKYMAEAIRNNISADEIIGRKSADNFTLLLKYLQKDELCVRLEQICMEIKKCCERNNKHYNLEISAGVYEVDNGCLDIDTMVDRADMPRNLIKGKHKINYAFYDEKIRDSQLHIKNIEDKMTEALENQEFIVYYQPKYNVANSKIAGAEALVRWVDSEKGLVPPGEFIPIFESNGFVTQLDKYVFRKVCIKVRDWLDRGLSVVPVSVNLSRLHLYNPIFIDEYKAILDEYRISSSLIQLELTESALFDNSNILIDIIARLHDLGFSILMDDFGTGYSSLNMLKDIPIDILKLDKGFVEGLTNNQKGRKIISSVIHLAQSLNMKVTAEGIETQEQYEFLKKINCDEIQGYYFAKPMSSEDFEKKLCI